MTSLVIAAHPDDETLGCGGTIARMAREGRDVYVVVLGEGITARYARREEGKSAVAGLWAACDAAARLLGVREVFKRDFPDNRFDTVPSLEIVKCLEAVLDQVRPDTIYTHHGGDLNIDHAIVFRATLAAARPFANTAVRRICAYEVPSSTDWAFDSFSPRFAPNVFVDVTDTLQTKIESMALYESEKRLPPHPRSAEAMRAAAHRWGAVVGVAAAEAFALVRELR